MISGRKAGRCIKNNTNSKSQKAAIGTNCTRQAYEASVLTRMKGRAGAYSPKGAPGIALEVMANDSKNISNVFKPDTVTKFTKSSTAPQVDAVTTTAGKVVERIQYKDTISQAGVKKTIDQVKSGKYRQVQLKGTIEATEKFNAAAKANGITKRMESTGISHNSTQRIGDRFTGQMINTSCLSDAVKGSVAGAVGVTAAIEIVKSVDNGDSLGECAGHVVSKGAESALTAAAATAAGEVAAGAAATLLATSTIPVVGPLVVGIGAAVAVGSVVGEVTDGVFDEVGDVIGNTVDDIGYGISNAADEIFCGVSGIVSEFFSLF